VSKKKGKVFSKEQRGQAEMETNSGQTKLPKRKIPLDLEKDGQINWEKKYEELLEWVRHQ